MHIVVLQMVVIVSESPKPKWYHFSLRFLLLVMVVLGALLAGVGFYWQQIRAPHYRQRAAIAELEEEVKVIVFWETDQSNWLTRYLDQQVVTLVRLEAGDSPVADRHIERLTSFHRLDYVTIVAPDENAELAGLKNLNNVSTLLLIDLKNSKSLAHVGEMKQLDRLEITFADDAQIKLDALSNAQSIQALAITTESLDFSWPFGKTSVGTRRIRDDFTPVGELSNLRNLTIASTSVNDEMVGQLLKLDCLERLVLSPISLAKAGAAEVVAEAIDYEIDDIEFSQAVEFLEDYAGSQVVVDDGVTIPNEMVSITPEDGSLGAFFAVCGMAILCRPAEILITTPKRAAELRPNLTKLKKNNPRLKEIFVVIE